MSSSYFDRDGCFIGVVGALVAWIGLSTAAFAQAPPATQPMAPATGKPLINQLGFKPGWDQRAFVMSTEEEKTARTSTIAVLGTSKVVREVPLQPGRLDEASGDWIRVIDFGKPLPVGQYELQVEGLSVTRFSVGDSVYHPLHRALLRSFYLQRCGVALDDRETGLAHPVCHVKDGVLAHADEVHPQGHRLAASGGWHDAGDYGKYVATTAVAIGRVLAAYERNPQRFSDDASGIPESGNRIPDLLDEMRIGLDWMLSMQRSDGAVYRKIGGRKWPHRKSPDDDTDQRLVYGVSSPETAKAAAAWAQASRLYKQHDAAQAARYLAAARLSWQWLQTVEQAQRFDLVDGDDSGSGPYRANKVDTEAALLYDWDDRLWAATELYLSTREAVFLAVIERTVPHAPLTLFEWKDPSSLAMSYLLWHPLLSDREILARTVRQRVLQRARNLTEGMKRSGWGIANQRFVWGSNKMTVEEGITLCMAYQIGGNKQYLAAARDQLHYVLGRNHFGKSFVSGMGSDPVREVSHLWFQVSRKPIPGLFVGGPNHLEQSGIAPRNKGPLSWIDDARSYATNEFAIDYNASLIGLVAQLETDCHTEESRR